jgi:dihydrodipicolinate synthase/N-acetylneuraminate lyase
MLALDGKAEEAKALNERLLPLHSVMFCEANPIPVKWALHKMGLMERGIRLPLVELDDHLKPRIEQTLKSLNLL